MQFTAKARFMQQEHNHALREVEGADEVHIHCQPHADIVH